MKQLILWFPVIAALSGCMSLQTSRDNLPYWAGRAVATDLLLRLTDPKYSAAYRIGIVNVTPAIGMRISTPGLPMTVEIIRGHDNFLWADAAAQIAIPGNNDNVPITVRRTIVSESACPAMTARLGDFFSELEKTLATPVNLASKLSDTSTDGIDEVTIDGTSFIIQLMAGDTKFAIMPDNGSNSALNSAVASLQSAVSNCANTIPEIVEQHYF